MGRYLHGSLNGDKGEAFINSMDNYSYNGLPKSEWYDESVDANNINGIDLLDDDIDSFWQQHGHTKDEYVEMASHIPEIDTRIGVAESEGKTREEALDECRNIDELRPCVETYYDNPVEVVALDDTYMATSDGRHRILAAQEAGVDMPVKVKGEYVDNSINSETMQGEAANVPENMGGNESEMQKVGNEADEVKTNSPANSTETLKNAAENANLPATDQSKTQGNEQAQNEDNSMNVQ